jgi:hypothetical protein
MEMDSNDPVVGLEPMSKQAGTEVPTTSPS